MNKFVYKLATGVISSALILGSTFTSVFAQNSTITNNGASSTNTIVLTNSNNCTITQGNVTQVNAIVKSNATTGGNKANSNTGGDVTIDTGNATATSTVSVTGGNNTISDPCCCNTELNPEALSTISNNGANSNNSVLVTDLKTNATTQGTSTVVNAKVKSKAKTGKNKANKNTNGTVEVSTGNSLTTSGLTVTSGNNSL